MFLKNAVYYTESISLFIVFLLCFSLLVEHLVFAVICHFSQAFKNFFNNIFGSDLIFYCLGNMWQAPAKKLAGVAAVGVYEAGVTVASEIAGSEVADKTLSNYPNQSLQEYNQTRNQAADKFYNRFSISGNFSTMMRKLFAEPSKS